MRESRSCHVLPFLLVSPAVALGHWEALGYINLPFCLPAMIAPKFLCQVTGTLGKSLAGILLVLGSL